MKSESAVKAPGPGPAFLSEAPRASLPMSFFLPAVALLLAAAFAAPFLAVKMADVGRAERLDLFHVHYAVPHATAAFLAAEMIGSSSQSGMGFLLIQSGQVMETEKVFASLVVLAIVGALIIKLQQWIDRKVAPWTAFRDGQ